MIGATGTKLGRPTLSRASGRGLGRVSTCVLVALLLLAPVSASAIPLTSRPAEDTRIAADRDPVSVIGESAARSEILGDVTTAAADDDFPGVVVTSPHSGALDLNAGDWLDIFQVTIGAGEVFTAEVTMSSGEWVSAAIFGPDAVDDSDLVALATVYDDTRDRLTIHSQAGGTYSLALFPPDEEFYGDGYLAYTLTFESNPPGDHSEVDTAIALTGGLQTSSLDWRTNVNDVYEIDLAEGDQLSLTLEPTVAGADPELTLWGPDAPSVWGSGPVAQFDWGSGTDEITFLVPPGGGGTYHVEVWTHIYTTGYRLTSSVAHPNVPRVAGANRWATSSAISKANWTGANAAVLATGSDPADALAASALAGVLDAPVMLVPAYSRYSALFGIYMELDRLGCTDVYIIGGEAAVDLAIEWELEDEWGFTVHRVSGVNRYVTAAEVATRARSIAPTSTAFVVRGDDFADALAVSPYAFAQGIPVLLTRPGSLHGSTRDFIEHHDITDVIVAGGDVAVSPGVVAQIEALNGGATTVTRQAGSNRYSTARDLATYCVETRAWASWDFVGVATGESFPDALGGGAACGKRGGALVLTRRSTLSGQASDVISAKDPEMVMVFGGPAAVSDGVKGSIQALMP